jgi:CheY-like chemotaxis protein
MNKYEVVYIIDDDPIFVFALKKNLLKIKDFESILNIQNGQEAIDNLVGINDKNQSFPDLIFLDLNMPMLDGWQFLDELESCSFKNKLNIYIVSSTIDERDLEKAKEYATVKRFISKPIGTKDLNQILEIV